MLDIRFILYRTILKLHVQVTKKMAESLPGSLVESRRRRSLDQSRQQRMQKKTSLGTGEIHYYHTQCAYLTTTTSCLPIAAR